MDLFNALFWFVAGATLMRAFSFYLNQKQQRDMIVTIISQFLVIAHEFRNQLLIALEIKRIALKDAGKNEEEVSKICSNEEQIIDKWDLVCSTIVLKGAPKSYIKYFTETDFKDFKK